MQFHNGGEAMNEIPLLVETGIGAGAALMALIGAARRAGLPKRFSGLVAIVAATVVGTVYLVGTGVEPQQAVIASVLWGGTIVAAHKTVVKPVVGT
jgi:hypothetical protein